MPGTLQITRTITTPADVESVFAYLRDFRSTEEWDPGTISTTLLSGDGGVGTVYANRSRFAGRHVHLTYVVVRLEPNAEITLRGEGPSVITHDEMRLRPLAGGGTELTYRAEFDFSGRARLLTPFVRLLLRRLGDEAEEGLRQALSKV